MHTYAIGDVHGCSRTLRRLLEVLPLEPGADRLWFVGDLVAQGPDSAGALRTVSELTLNYGERVAVVLGNHDLRLLAARDGVKVPRKVEKLLAELSAQRDGDALLDWLSERPLLHVEGGAVLVHAGLLPWWTVDEARGRANEAAAILASPGRADFLRHFYDKSGEEHDGKAGAGLERAIHSTRVMTTIRTVRADGTLCDWNEEPERAPAECRPWFAHSNRAHRDATVLFGHWAALGLRLGDSWIGLDSGCAWGGPLSAVRLEDRRVFQTPRID